MPKLNLGAGTDIRQGWVNLDASRLPGIEVVHNIEHLPLPFDGGAMEEILCQDILEHLEYIPVLKDIHRILASGGKLRIRVPHFTSKNNFIDPTHKKLFSIETFDFFVRGTASHSKRPYYFDFSFSASSDKKILFDKSRKFFPNRLIEPLINLGPNMQRFYESTFLSRMFPAENLEVALIK